MIYNEINSNKRKSYFLIFLFLIIIALIGYAAGIYYGNRYAGLIIALVVSIIYCLIAFYSGDKMVLGLNKAIEAKKQDHPFYVNTVEGISIAAGINTPKAYVINDEAINAFATGRDPEHASITVTTGALKKLNRSELEGVISHEISHIKNYDIRLMMLVVILVGIIILLSHFFLRSMWFGKGGSKKDSGGLGVILLVVGIILAIFAPLIAQLIKLAVSRKREFLADASGALLTRHPQGLADALKKIKEDPNKLKIASKATEHLYIANPFKNKGKIMFSTHPNVDERIKRLEGM